MFEHAFDPGSDPKRPFHHVGVEKYRLREHDFAHWFFDDKADKSVRAIDPFRRTKDGRVGAAAEGFTGRSLKFQLREPERVTNPAFNVLYVQTQKPTVLRVPLVRAFLDTWAETVELVRPALRFGVPESSLRDKCKYWREDGSAIPGAVSLQTQRMLKSLDSEYVAARTGLRPPPTRTAPEAAAGAAAASTKAPGGPTLEYWKSHGHSHAHGQGHGHHHGEHKHLSQFAAKEEFIELVTPWVVFGLNVAAWMWLGNTSMK